MNQYVTNFLFELPPWKTFVPIKYWHVHIVKQIVKQSANVVQDCINTLIHS